MSRDPFRYRGLPGSDANHLAQLRLVHVVASQPIGVGHKREIAGGKKPLPRQLLGRARYAPAATVRGLPSTCCASA